MGTASDEGLVPVPWWRYLLMCALIAGFYFAVRAVAESPQTHPALLGPAVVLGGALGVAVGRRGAALLAEPLRTGHRGRRRRAGSRRTGGPYLAGLTGVGLILAQTLSSTGFEWVMLGGVALMVGAAGHAWVMARRYERAGVSVAD